MSRDNEATKQRAKERAVLLALRKGRGLIRRGLEIWGLKVDGSEIRVVKSSSYEELWQNAVKILKKKK